ncbi:MAG: hypothetical protein NTV50_00265 [Planctomycetota bacterium]|nr:hypothetical protein [Planctomycetota bacterium]
MGEESKKERVNMSEGGREKREEREQELSFSLQLFLMAYLITSR